MAGQLRRGVAMYRGPVRADPGGVVCRRTEVTIPYRPPPWKSPPGTLKADPLSLRTELWATCRNEEHVVQGAVIYLKDNHRGSMSARGWGQCW